MSPKVLAPAKLNLVLKVLYRREDGYHELFTIFQKITLFDTLEFKFRSDSLIRLEIEGQDLPQDEQNLCVKAALLFREKAHLDFGLEIFLTKKIPVGAGLGGGSSDAAAVLNFLNQCFKTFSSAELLKLGKLLGADVPFFLTPWSTALGRGIGERLTPWPTHPAWYLVVVPELKISTVWAYQNLRLTTPNEPPNYVPDQPLWDQGLVNDFESLIFGFYPELKRLKEYLIEAGAKAALLSGSGASIFGVFEEEKKAKKTYDKLKGENLRLFLVTNYIPSKGAIKNVY